MFKLGMFLGEDLKKMFKWNVKIFDQLNLLVL